MTHAISILPLSDETQPPPDLLKNFGISKVATHILEYHFNRSSFDIARAL